MTNLIYLGNFSSLNVDPTENNYDAENAALLNGVSADHNTLQIVSASIYDGGDGVVRDDDFGTSDSISYDTGSGTTMGVTDASLQANVTVTLQDDSTINVEAVVMQMSNGDLFISDLLNNGTLDNLQISNIEINSITGSNFSGWFSNQSADNTTIAAPDSDDDGDGIVEGTNDAEVIDASYDDDPEGDMIDNNDAILAGEGPQDDIVDAFGGNDTIISGEGDDDVYAGSGEDSVDGGVGDDLIYGDSNLQDGPTSDDSDDKILDWGTLGYGTELPGGASVDTGGVTVNVTFQSEDTGALICTEATEQHVASGESFDPNSSLMLFGAGGEGGVDNTSTTTFSFDATDPAYSDQVQDVSFRINDVDTGITRDQHVDIVTVRAYDTDNNLISVSLTNTGTVAITDDTATGNDGSESHADPSDSSASVLVNIAGPVSRIEIDYDNGDTTDQKIWLTDVHFSTISSAIDTDDGADGNDTLLGGDGEDTIFGEGGDDSIEGGSGDDDISGGTGNDLIYGDAKAEGPGALTITIDEDNGSFTGDVLVEITGADGAVRVETAFVDYDSNVGNTVIVDLAAGDSVRVGITDSGADPVTHWSDVNTDTMTTVVDEDTVTLSFEDATDADFNDVILTASVEGDVTLLTTAGPVTGTAGPTTTDGNDTITGGAGSDTIFGGGGDDSIDAGNGSFLVDKGYPGAFPGEEGTPATEDDRDLVDGGDGNDTISTGDDADTITGGIGDDVIDGGIDDDVITGDDGADRIVGGEGNDNIEGGIGNDTIFAGNDPDDGLDLFDIEDDGSNLLFGPDLRPDNGQDTVSGGEGNDLIFGADDDDVLAGDAGNDTIDGGVDDDDISGGTGDDSLIGGQGDDTISGGDNNDLIDGGIGNDVLSGNGDRDTFVNVNAGDVVDGGEAGDDFDVLDLTGSAEAGQHIQVIYDPLNAENGTVEYRDDEGDVVDTLTFTNIENVIPCFTPGTLIATARGERRVEDLVQGDRIITRDNGIQAIRWVGAREMTGAEFEVAAHLKPILIQQGALGNGLPERDMMVSPQHRVLIANEKTSLYFDESEVLVAAKFLTGLDGVDVVDVSATTYIHIMFDQHEVVLSDGAWTESFQPGDQSLAGVGDTQRSEILELFPELETRTGIDGYTSARRALKKHEAILVVK